jgi:NAD(P)-dependent dehydrogenase (short-subunit alcohol dehydrogenase family)
MATVLITGAGRGIGLEFVRQYAAGHKVLATVRDPAAATELAALPGDIEVHALDMTDRAALAAFPATLGGAPIDIAVLNAGVGGTRSMSAGGGDDWLRVLEVNTIAPTLLAIALLAQLRAAGGRAVAITSQMGSIADNGSGGYLDYRSSKAALNAAWVSLGIEWKAEPVALGLLHPGWVKTDMGGPNATTTPAESVAGMRRVIDGLRPGAGCPFMDFRGKTLPW